MIIKTLTVGAFASNNYLVVCEETHTAALIDAGGDYEATIRAANQEKAALKSVFHTHGHLDHISGSFELKTRADVGTYIHESDKFLVYSLGAQLNMFGLPDVDIPAIDDYLYDGQILEVGSLEFRVIHTPGHSPGSVCFLVDNVLFSGDTLFADSVGRTDLPGGSYEQLRDSIVNKLFALDDDIKVYPGHGPSTTIGHEKANNPFFGVKA